MSIELNLPGTSPSDSPLTPGIDVGAASPPSEGLYGLLAEFNDPGALSEAAQAMREAGYRKYDVYSSFPIHGMEERLGMGLSNITYFTGGGALAGCTTAFAMQWFMNAYDYEFITAGKPYFAWEQFTPVAFALSVLFAAISTLTGMFILNGLPRHYHALLKNERFVDRAHDDGYLLAVEARDPKFDVNATASKLRELGAISVEMVEE
ncbi:MAG: DUF3341 domain-containing protein [Planctomycetota bacterium]